MRHEERSKGDSPNSDAWPENGRDHHRKSISTDDPSCGQDADNTIILIDDRPLFREMMEKCLAAEFSIVSFSSSDQWLSSTPFIRASVVVLAMNGKLSDDMRRCIEVLVQRSERPLVVVGESAEPGEIVGLLESGVRGYVPNNLSLESVIEAIRFVKAGGTFAPASTFIAAFRQGIDAQPNKSSAASIFTARQAAVVHAIRRGKANKIIAHELCMREGTVKVHIRNIMRKLKAHNRTEVAFLTRDLVA